MKITPAHRMAGKLNYSQMCMIFSLKDGPSLLGCSEPVARRLSHPSGKRPALVSEIKAPSERNPHWSAWHLNETGKDVEAALRELLNYALS